MRVPHTPVYTYAGRDVTIVICIFTQEHTLKQDMTSDHSLSLQKGTKANPFVKMITDHLNRMDVCFVYLQVGLKSLSH